MLKSKDTALHPIERQTKLDLAHEINSIIQKKRLTQKQAALLTKATQPDISKISNQQLCGFTVDRLLAILFRLDNTVKLKIISSFTAQNDAQHCA